MMICIFLFMLVSILSISNSEVFALSDYDNALIERGYPKESFENMTFEEKEMLIEGNYEFGGYDVLSVDVAPNTRGTLTQDEMKVEILKTISRNNGDLVDIFVMVTYDWQIITNLGFTDAWGIAWDSEILRYKDDSYNGRTQFYTVAGVLVDTTHYDSLSKANSYSIASHVDQRITQAAEHIQTFKLEPIESTSDGRTQIYASYAHSFFVNGVSINLPIYGGATVSFSGASDQITKASTIYW